MRQLRTLVCDRVRLLLSADSRFARTALAHPLAGMTNVSFLVRIKSDVHVRHPRFTQAGGLPDAEWDVGGGRPATARGRRVW